MTGLFGDAAGESGIGPEHVALLVLELVGPGRERGVVPEPDRTPGGKPIEATDEGAGLAADRGHHELDNAQLPPVGLVPPRRGISDWASLSLLVDD